MIVTPVGTCRITTPLRRAAQRSQVELALSGVYGFVHTSREALQMIRGFSGQFSIDESLVDLVARPGHKQTNADKSDLLLIEISSLKDVRIGETSLQLNYMQRCFGDFFLDAERAKQFWRMAGPNDKLKSRRQWLDTLPAFHQLEKSNQERLACITRHMLGREDIKRHIVQMQDASGDAEIAIVSHVDARKPDGSTIASRSQLIEWLESICKDLDVSFFNPTNLMESRGQSVVMEKGGKDLTHFTPAFSDLLFEELVSVGIVKTDKSAKTDDLAIKIQEAMEYIRQDRLSDAGSVAYSMLETSPRPEVEELVAALESRIGNHKGALARLTSLKNDSYRLSEDSRRTMMLAYHALGDFENALREANGLISEEIESEAVLRVAALSAEGVGKVDEAVALWTILYGQGGEKAAINLIRLAGKSPTVRDIARKELEALPNSTVPAEVLWRHFVDLSDFERSRVSARHLRNLDKHEAEKLLNFASHYPRHQAEIARIFAKSGQITSDRLDKLRKSYSTAMSKTKGSDEVSQLATASAVVTLDKSDESRKKLRDLRTKVRRNLASMQSKGEHKKVISWVQRIVDGSVDIPKAAYFAGRSSVALEDFAGAVHWLQCAIEDTPSDLQTQRTLIRAYDLNGQQDKAITLAHEMLQSPTLSSQDSEQLQKRLASMKTRVINRVREFVNAEQFREAISMLSVMDAINMDPSLVQAERVRLLRAMEKQLIESSLDDTADSEWLGESILKINPTNQRGLKSMATLTMRQRRYKEAINFWSRLSDIREKPETALAQVAKCKRLLTFASA